MSSESFARAKAIFLDACSRPPASRARFVEQQCGDDSELRAEVESLLEFHASEERFEPAEVFAGRYRILSELGRGGMGEVYRAHDLVLDEPVAVKLLPEVDEPSLETLLNEVRMARRVTHPNVCRVYDFGGREGELYLTMELIDGEDLGSLLSRIGRLPRDKAVELAHEICAGLAAAHRGGVLHRDLKPANVMIDGRGQAKIMDFGVAARIGARGQAAGTPAYMAPEQKAGQEVSERSDIYAFGLLFHEMLTGEPRLEVDGQGDRHSRPMTASARQLMGPDLEALIDRCLVEDPEERPASIAEVAAALPSDDRLRALVEAGRTPSPEDVAAAGRQRAQEVMVDWRWMASLLLLLAALPWLADAGLPGRASWSTQAPALLVERARAILRESGVPEPPRDSAWGFHSGAEYYAEGLFWYRQSEAGMLPIRIDSVLFEARVAYDDPPQTEPGMARLELAADGRLATLEVEPSRLGSPTGGSSSGAPTGSSTGAAEVDPAAFLRLAGYDVERLERVVPAEWPPVFADQRAAWLVREAGVVRRIEAAWLAGRPVFFVNLPVSPAPPELVALEERVVLWSGVLWNVLFIGLAIVALGWARANRAAGRGDLQGANRIVAVLLVMSAAAWVLGSDFVPDVEAESLRVVAALGWMLVQAAVAWLVYVALEPFVRRNWPQSLLAWSQALRGRVRSPLVGRDLVIGSVVGIGWAALDQLDHLAVRALRLEPLVELFAAWQLEAALQLRSTLANALSSLVDAIHQGLLALFFLAALQRWLVAPAARNAAAEDGSVRPTTRSFGNLRRRWFAVLLFVITIGALEMAEGSHPAVSWLTLGVGIGGLTAVVLLRWGVLALVVAEAVFYFLQTSPVTLDAPAWYAETGTFALALVLVVALFGWWATSERSRALPHPVADSWHQDRLTR